MPKKEPKEAGKKVRAPEANDALTGKAWHLVNAENQILGRLASRLAVILSGKDKVDYERHVDKGDFVVVVNAARIRVTGKKRQQKFYKRFSNYPSGLKEKSFTSVMAENPVYPLRHAVQGMLPKNALGNHMLKKLKIYAGPDHPHAAEKPQELKIEP